MADSDLDKQLLANTTALIEDFRLKLIDILRNDRKLKTDSRSLNSLVVEINESGKSITLWGTSYMYYVIHGRGPGRFPPPDPITGKWKIPFPVAAKIAKFGNKAKYAHVAQAFDKIYNDLLRDLTKQAGNTSLAYVLKLGTVHNTTI